AVSFGHLVWGQALYVGDTHNDTIEAIEVSSGTYVGAFVHSSNDAEDYKISGPRGVIFAGSACLVINQNVDLPISGEVLKFDANTGAFLTDLVPFSDANAPFAPRAMIAIGGTLYVSDTGNFDNVHQGQIQRYNLANGSYLGKVDTTGF